jgi:S-formylglutathione hydrolase FrmB
MGGHGAMKLAIKHPEVYCAIVSHSGLLSLNRWQDGVRFNPNWTYGGYLPYRAMAIAFSPNPNNLPLYFDYPADDKGNLLDDVWQRWLEHDPVTLIKTHRANLKRLAGIYFDHGRSDSTVSVEDSRDLDKALTEAGIPHVYEEYDGGHGDQWPSRLYIALPFLSDLLSSKMAVAVHPQGKLAVTWASLKRGR